MLPRCICGCRCQPSWAVVVRFELYDANIRVESRRDEGGILPLPSLT
jgi:hypothetical protein